MARLGRFYVLGPPLKGYENVETVVSTVMRQTPDMEHTHFTLANLEGPVRYDSSWIPGGRTSDMQEQEFQGTVIIRLHRHELEFEMHHTD